MTKAILLQLYPIAADQESRKLWVRRRYAVLVAYVGPYFVIPLGLYMDNVVFTSNATHKLTIPAGHSRDGKSQKTNDPS